MFYLVELRFKHLRSFFPAAEYGPCLFISLLPLRCASEVDLCTCMRVFTGVCVGRRAVVRFPVQVRAVAYPVRLGVPRQINLGEELPTCF